MGFSARASQYNGALLDETDAMEIFGAKYEKRVRDKCPNDEIENPDKSKFCGECGSSLEYDHPIRQGASNLEEIQFLPKVEESGLDVLALSEESNGQAGILIGEKTAGSGDICEGGEVKGSEERYSTEELQKKLAELGVTNQVKGYLVTSASC